MDWNVLLIIEYDIQCTLILRVFRIAPNQSDEEEEGSPVQKKREATTRREGNAVRGGSIHNFPFPSSSPLFSQANREDEQRPHTTFALLGLPAIRIGAAATLP